MRFLTYRFPPRNLTSQERVIRSTLGLAGITMASMQWEAGGVAGHSAVALLAWAVVIGASLDLLVSGVVGYCPLYRWVEVPWGLRDQRAERANPSTGRITRRRLGWLAYPGDGSAVQLGLIVEHAVKRFGPIPLWLDRPLDIAPEQGIELDYVRLGALIVDASRWLAAAGASAGDYVAIIKRENMDILVLAAAASRLGAVPALLSPGLHPAAMDELLERLGRPLVIADRAAAERYQFIVGPGRAVVVDGALNGTIDLNQLRGAIPPPVVQRAPDDVAAVTHTSGTTGVPKLCMHTGRSLAGQACVQLIAHKVMLTRRDIFATCPTAIHARVLSGWHALLAVGCGHLALFDPDPMVTATFLSRYQPTVVDTFPNVYIRWEQFANDAGGPLANVRFFISTFDAVHPRTIQRLLAASRRRFPLWVQGYAQSEVGLATLGVRRRRRTGHPTGDARDVGWAVPGLTRVRITDRITGKPLPRGSLGQIEVGSVGQIAGYLGEESRMAGRWNGAWWRMEDVGQMTPWGTLRLLGRQVDAIPGLDDALALEDMLLARLPELTELVILAGLDGQLPVPVVCTIDDEPLHGARWSSAMLGLPPLAAPVQCRWAELPTTATWKVKRSELREQLMGSPPGYATR